MRLAVRRNLLWVSMALTIAYASLLSISDAVARVLAVPYALAVLGLYFNEERQRRRAAR